MRQEMIQAVEREKLIAIIRGADRQQCMHVAEALYEGGIRLMEITYNQSDPATFQNTADTIGQLAKRFEGRMFIGAGTVTTPELVDMTAAAGGRFIISPDTNEAVIRRTRELGLVSIPGAMTPTEVMQAHRAGADFVKLFPAGLMGAAYFKAVCTPISHVKMLAVAGITDANIGDFLRAGAVGAGVSGDLANKAWIEKGEYYKITETAKKLIDAIKAV